MTQEMAPIAAAIKVNVAIRTPDTDNVRKFTHPCSFGHRLIHIRHRVTNSYLTSEKLKGIILSSTNVVIDHHDVIKYMHSMGLRFKLHKPQIWGTAPNSTLLDDVTAHVDLTQMPNHPPRPAYDQNGIPEFHYTVSMELLLFKPEYNMPKPVMVDAAINTDDNYLGQYPDDVIAKLDHAQKLANIAALPHIQDAFLMLEDLFTLVQPTLVPPPRPRPSAHDENWVEDDVTPNRPIPRSVAPPPVVKRTRSPLFTKTYRERHGDNIPDNVAEYGSDDDSSQRSVIRHNNGNNRRSNGNNNSHSNGSNRSSNSSNNNSRKRSERARSPADRQDNKQDRSPPRRPRVSHDDNSSNSSNRRSSNNGSSSRRR